MRRARWLWHELTRPRGVGAHRYYRVGRRSRSGMALMLVLTSILFLTVIATEVTHGAAVRIQLAAHQRDEVKAEALAHTGLQVYRLILVASKGLGQQFGAMMASFGMTADALWQMVPFINTGMMRMLLVSGSDLEEAEAEQFAEEGLTEEQREESMEGSTGSKRNFLDFDGDFFAEVSDEDSKVFAGNITATSLAELMENQHAQQLFSLMGGEENDQFFYDRNLERWELIGDLADWTDLDDDRLYQGGSESALYMRLEDPYKPKNAAFDSLKELRLVNGWHRDDVWERIGDNITLYGAGKINVNTASNEAIVALLRTYVTPNTQQFHETLLNEIGVYKSLATYANARAFTSHLESLGATVAPGMAGAITTESNTFRIKSTGQVRDAVVTIEAVVDFSRSQLGQVVYWRVE